MRVDALEYVLQDVVGVRNQYRGTSLEGAGDVAPQEFAVAGMDCGQGFVVAVRLRRGKAWHDVPSELQGNENLEKTTRNDGDVPYRFQGIPLL